MPISAPSILPSSTGAWASMWITSPAIWQALARRSQSSPGGLTALPRHENLGGVEVFRESPQSMKDGMEIFLSPETLAWGEGLKFLLDLLSYNQLSLGDLMREEPFQSGRRPRLARSARGNGSQEYGYSSDLSCARTGNGPLGEAQSLNW